MLRHLGERRPDDPRLDFAVLLKLAHPDWSIVRVGREAGGVEKCRIRDELLAEGLIAPRAGSDTLTAPAWYADRPCGRIAALRAAHGITP